MRKEELRFEEETSLANGDEELQKEEHLLKSNISKCARVDRGGVGAPHKEQQSYTIFGLTAKRSEIVLRAESIHVLQVRHINTISKA